MRFERPICPHRVPGPCSSRRHPSGAITRSHRLVSVLLRRPGGRPALPPGAGGPPATVRQLSAESQRERAPQAAEPGVGAAERLRFTELTAQYARASASPSCSPCASATRRPRRELAPAAVPAGAGAAHRLGRGEEDLPPASRRPARGQP